MPGSRPRSRRHQGRAVFTDPEGHAQPDATSGSSVVGLEETSEVILDGRKLLSPALI
jgi:hypothetical protein